MKRMLFNATQEEELRVAMVDGQRLYDLNIELPASERKKANIYKGRITRIEPSLEAAFVNYGADRHGFLPLKEISPEYYVSEVQGGGKPNIRDVLREGQDIVIQIDKEERGNKGAALTTYVSLAGRFIVLKPNKARSGGVSRRIVGDDRDLARQSLKEVTVPDGMSVILRTAGIDRSAEELEWDLNNLLAIWEAIKTVVVQRPSPFLIYRESDSVVRALRDYFTNEIGEILIDDQKAYDQAREFIEQVMPHNLRKLKHYEDPVPLFTRYQIESQIESAFAHQVTLPSGGSMVIDHTEALVSIDINSARATKGGDIEATALQTNLEAADEVGRQLRLRDLGGLVVIDFIDMGPQKHQREVEARLRDAVRQDRARVQIGKISRFGLLEMSRQRLRPSLGESSYLTCPRCSGVGTIRSVESLALAILRIIGEEARKERTAKVIAQLPVEVATYLLNEKRDWVQNVEARHKMQVILVANPGLETPHYVVRRVRDDQLDLPENVGTSYALVETEEEQLIPQAIQAKPPTELPAVASTVATTPAPPPRSREEPKEAAGFLSKILSIFAPAEVEKEEKTSQPSKKGGNRNARGGQRKRRAGDGQQDDGNRSRSKKKTKRKRKKASGDGAETDKQTAAARGDTKSKKKRRSKKKPQAENQAAPEESRDQQERSQEKPSGRRRSRGGRRRRRSKDAGDSSSGEQQANPANRGSDQPGNEAADGNRAKQDNSTRAKASEGPATEPRTNDAESRGGTDAVKGEKPGGAEAAARPESRADEKRSGDQPAASAGNDSSDRKVKSGSAAASTAAATVDEQARPADNAATPRSDDSGPSNQEKSAADARAAASADQPSVAEGDQQSGSGNGKPAPAEGDGKPDGGSDEQPKTRLLPWEPQPVAENDSAPEK